MIKISAGEFKGRSITIPKGGKASHSKTQMRPTLSKLREAIFDSLGPWVESKAVLDLYAGSGSLGIEALSRGASTVIFVDQDSNAIRAIRKTIQDFTLEDRAQTMKMPVDRYISKTPPSSIDLVLMDPPYGKGFETETLKAPWDAILSQEGRIVIDCDKRTELPELFGVLAKTRDRTYGDSRLVTYERA